MGAPASLRKDLILGKAAAPVPRQGHWQNITAQAAESNHPQEPDALLCATVRTPLEKVPADPKSCLIQINI